MMSISVSSGMAILARQKAKSEIAKECHGLLKVSLEDLNWTESIPNVHEGQIRGLVHNPLDFGSVLTTAWDKKLKITNVNRSNSTVMRYNFDVIEISFEQFQSSLKRLVVYLVKLL